MSESFSYTHQTCTNLAHSFVWILLRQASNMHKTQALLRLNPSHAQTCAKITHSFVWILIVRASKLHKPHPLLCLNPSHTCTSSPQTSATPASESFSCLHKTCTNLTHSCVWILLIQASNLHKPRPLLRLNPSDKSIKPAQTTTTLTPESFSCLHQTCANITHSCARILIVRALDMHKPHPLLRLNYYQASIKSAQTSPTPASDSLSYMHQNCTNLSQSCVWIPLSCVHQTCTNLTHSCVWILLIRAPNLHKHHPILRRNPSHACIKSVQASPTPASESISCVHQTCTYLTHSCVWILIMRASNLHKPHSLLVLNPYHACIKPAQSSRNPASESLSCVHQTCKNLTHSCVWTLLMRASDMHKPHSLLCLNPSHSHIKSAQTTTTLASESFSCVHRPAKTSPTAASESFSCLHKDAQTSPTPVSESFSYTHQNCKRITRSCLWILLIQASNLHKPRLLLRLNPSHKSIKPAKTSPTAASESFSCLHKTCTNLTHSCVWIFLLHASKLQKHHPLLPLNPSYTCIKPAQTSPSPASESLTCEH